MSNISMIAEKLFFYCTGNFETKYLISFSLTSFSHQSADSREGLENITRVNYFVSKSGNFTWSGFLFICNT